MYYILVFLIRFVFYFFLVRYYAAFPALSSESKVSVQIQNLSMNQLPEKTCNVWKKKQLLQQQQQQQQQSPKLAATLSTQTDNSVNLESAPTRGRQNNSASRRRRGNFSQTGNKENLHNHFTRGKDDHGSYNTSHNNRLRSGHCRTNRSVVSNNMPKFCQGSSRQSNSRSVGTRRHGEGGVGETCGVNVPPSSDIDFCFRTEPELKDVLRTTNKNSQAEKSVQEPHYACVSESNRNEGDGYEEDSQWYNVSFPIVSLASSNSNTGLRSDERSYVRLFHRHSNPPSSPRSAVSLDNIEKKEFPKVSSCLGPHTDKDFKKSLSSEGTDKMYAATKRVVDTSMRSILDCSPEEILPSSAQSPSEEVDCTVQLVNLTQSFVNKSMIASGTFGPAADGLNKSASLIKALSPGVASPTTPVSSSSSSLMDIAYITKLDDLDGKQIEAARNQSNAFRIEGLFSSFFDSSYQLVAEIKTSRRSNFAHDPCVMVSNSVTEGETQNPVVGPVGQNLYNATSYTFLQERLVSGVQRSDIVAQNEQLSQFWDLNFQRHVISNNQNSHNDIDDSPSARPLPHSADQVISQTVTPFSYFSPSVLNPSTTNVISTSITHNSASVTTTRVLPACVSSTEVTRNCETSFVNSKQISQQAGVMSTACSNMYQILDDSSSISLSSSPNVKLALTMTTTVLSSSYSVISSTSSGTSSSSSSPSFQEPPRMEPTQASALVPSTNSAFERVVPSERSIMDANQDEQRITPEDEEVMRQVNRVSSNETLYFSPRTHFRPIDSPPITTVEHSVLNNETITDTSLDLVVQSREPVSPLRHYQTLDLFGGYTGSCSPYQLFKPDSYKDNGEGICEGFIPSFKITKTHDKFVQTGNLEENVDVDLVKLAEELCAENVNPRSVLFLNNARCCSPSSVCTWRQPNRLQEFTGWRYSRNERCVHLNWNSDDPQWTPVSSTSSWSSALSSPTSTSLEHHRYSSTRDSCWHTGAETMSAVRDDAWLSSSSGTPNSGLSTPFTTSTSSQTRIHVVCKTKATNEISVCTSSDVISEVENWRSNSSDWTVNSTTPFYLQANPRRCELEEGCREMVVDKAACKLVNSRTRNELLSPETHTQASSLQSMWPKKTCKPESYAHQDEVLSKGPKPSLSSANSFVQRGTKVSTEEEPVLENQDGSCSPRTISKIWANSNSIMWSMPQFTHSSSSSTSASLAASPASISSPPLSSLTLPPTSNDSLLDLVCGPACAQTAGASKPCQHQQLRKIWEHVDPTTTSSSSSSTGHGDVNETTKDSLHQLYGAKENQLLLMNNMQTRSSHELPSFGSARRLARVPIMPPGIKNQSSKYQKPQSKIMVSPSSFGRAQQLTSEIKTSLVRRTHLKKLSQVHALPPTRRAQKSSSMLLTTIDSSNLNLSYENLSLHLSSSINFSSQLSVMPHDNLFRHMNEENLQSGVFDLSLSPSGQQAVLELAMAHESNDILNYQNPSSRLFPSFLPPSSQQSARESAMAHDKSNDILNYQNPSSRLFPSFLPPSSQQSARESAMAHDKSNDILNYQNPSSRLFPSFLPPSSQQSARESAMAHDKSNDIMNYQNPSSRLFPSFLPPSSQQSARESAMAHDKSNDILNYQNPSSRLFPSFLPPSSQQSAQESAMAHDKSNDIMNYQNPSSRLFPSFLPPSSQQSARESAMAHDKSNDIINYQNPSSLLFPSFLSPIRQESMPESIVPPDNEYMYEENLLSEVFSLSLTPISRQSAMATDNSNQNVNSPNPESHIFPSFPSSSTRQATIEALMPPDNENEDMNEENLQSEIFGLSLTPSTQRASIEESVMATDNSNQNVNSPNPESHIFPSFPSPSTRQATIEALMPPDNENEDMNEENLQSEIFGLSLTPSTQRASIEESVMATDNSNQHVNSPNPESHIFPSFPSPSTQQATIEALMPPDNENEDMNEENLQSEIFGLSLTPSTQRASIEESVMATDNSNQHVNSPNPESHIFPSFPSPSTQQATIEALMPPDNENEDMNEENLQSEIFGLSLTPSTQRASIEESVMATDNSNQHVNSPNPESHIFPSFPSPSTQQATIEALMPPDNENEDMNEENLQSEIFGLSLTPSTQRASIEESVMATDNSNQNVNSPNPESHIFPSFPSPSTRQATIEALMPPDNENEDMNEENLQSEIFGLSLTPSTQRASIEESVMATDNSNQNVNSPNPESHIFPSFPSPSTRQATIGH